MIDDAVKVRVLKAIIAKVIGEQIKEESSWSHELEEMKEIAQKVNIEFNDFVGVIEEVCQAVITELVENLKKEGGA